MRPDERPGERPGERGERPGERGEKPGDAPSQDSDGILFFYNIDMMASREQHAFVDLVFFIPSFAKDMNPIRQLPGPNAK
ncbi:hypothetical protein VDGL01_12140 [Verticillium dahliae]